MAKIEFADFSYYPDLLCSFSEHEGYRQLSTDDKDALLPVFELSQLKNGAAFVDSQAAILEVVGHRPFILDLSKDPAPPPYVPKDASPDEQERIDKLAVIQAAYNTSVESQLNSAGDFAVWRETVAKFPSCIPVLQCKDMVSQMQALLGQAASLSKDNHPIAIRVGPNTEQAASVIAQVLSVLAATDQLLIIVDCGQSRRSWEDRGEAAGSLMKQIEDKITIGQQPYLRAVCMSNSFPNASHLGLKQFESYDWKVWQHASDSFPFLFGDYGAMHRRKPTSTFIPPDWIAAVGYSLDEGWLIYKDENSRDPQGWVKGSKLVITHTNYVDLPDAWGNSLIKQGASGKIDGLESARFWHAARVNIHLHRQLGFAPSKIAAASSWLS